VKQQYSEIQSEGIKKRIHLL